MVKTRHSLDLDGDRPGEFSTLKPKDRRNRPVVNYRDYDDHDDHCGLSTTSQRRTTRHSKSTQLDSEHIQLNGDVSEDMLASDEHTTLASRTSRKSTRAYTNPNIPDTLDSREWPDVPEDSIFEDYQDDGRRRSSRNRKLYENFKQSITSNAHDFEGDTSTPEGPLVELPRKRRRVESDVREAMTEEGDDSLDMYTRVKRVRRKIKRDMYGMPLHEQEKTSEESETGDSDGEIGEESEDEEVEEPAEASKSYNLREFKPRTEFYKPPPREHRLKKPKSIFHCDSPTHSPIRRQSRMKYSSPSKREMRSPSYRKKRSRAAFHDSSSTSSSSSGSDSSDDEKRFQRRKAKSMAKSRMRILPMNMNPGEAAASGILRDRAKIGSSLADVDPMSVDRSITFDSVGGLGKHILALKEMIVFPLLYPEVFERFKIAPPRGVLFHGPPGTGKTLVARALANECSHGDKRVSFFMRKGADCLSKWVGESERQLRLLFDQAYQMRPSIIFFDEIDGLAPIRSSRQDQIHSSIVSTLLALMDGLDSRGEIVIIGATNRIDSIDSALRRPGRFDREFLFPLPSLEARSQILRIHTSEWNPKLSVPFMNEVAQRCVGYCGADMRALCTEAALLALRRRYPQIYTSKDKLSLDVTSINVSARDFHNAMQAIVPAAQRSIASPGRALSLTVQPLMQGLFETIKLVLDQIFPVSLTQINRLDTQDTDRVETGLSSHDDDLCDDDEDEEEDLNIYDVVLNSRVKETPEHMQMSHQSFLSFTSSASRRPLTHRPCLLLAGTRGQGQSSHLGPAIVHHLEKLPVHVLDLPTLFANSVKTPEESIAQVFREARRTSPSIVYLPRVNRWWEVLSETMKATFQTVLYDIVPSDPVLLLATSDQPYRHLDRQVQVLFSDNQTVAMRNPSKEEIREFFCDLILRQATRAPPSRKAQSSKRVLEVLPKAPPPEPRKLTSSELRRLRAQEEATLRELRLFLREVLNKLARDRKFHIFTKPVDSDDAPDYHEIITNPMDLSRMMNKIDRHLYECADSFVEDINLICSNALEYNPPKDATGRAIRHRACALKDTCNAIIDSELDPEFDEMCKEIMESRKRRGEEPEQNLPDFLNTRPLATNSSHSKQQPAEPSSLAVTMETYPVRFSKRTRGMDADEAPACNQDPVNTAAKKELDTRELDRGDANVLLEKVTTPDASMNVHRVSPRKSYSRKVSIWCKSRRRRKKGRRQIQYSSSAKVEDISRVKNGDLQDNNLSEFESDPAEKIPYDVIEPIEVFDKETKQGFLECDSFNEVSISTDACLENEAGPSPWVSTKLPVHSQKNTNTKPQKMAASTKKTCTSQTDSSTDQTDNQPQIKDANTSTIQPQRVGAFSDQPVPPLVVDRARLSALLDRVVQEASGGCVDHLERLHSLLAQCIYRHRKNYNKTQLTQEMEDTLAGFIIK